MKISEIDRFHIVLEVEGEAVLSIRMTAAGQINRMGDGTGEASTAGWYLGQTEEPLFQQWISLLEEELLQMAGRYDLPDPKGEDCALTITLEAGETSTGFAFRYGSESLGPPSEIMELVNAAVDLSDEWWQSQRHKRKRL